MRNLSAILLDLKPFFVVQEFVCPDIYKAYKENAWQFIDRRLLENILWLRKASGRAVIINTWHKGGTLSQRGLRCNLCALVLQKTKIGQLYLSAHQQGMALDFDLAGWTADKTRKFIEAHQDEMPYPVRLESDVTWVHMDVRTKGTEKVTYFKG